MCSVAANTKDGSGVHIIDDMEKDVTFCSRPYVKDGPKVRFYAGVPITTPRGIRIGAYCCLDDKPRDGLDPLQINFLKDIAATVMAHLEMVRGKAEQERGSRMVTGLGAFIEGASTLSEPSVPTDRNYNHRTPATRKLTDHKPAAGLATLAAPPLPNDRSTTTTQSQESPQASPKHLKSDSSKHVESGRGSPVIGTPTEGVDAGLARSIRTKRQADGVRHELVASNVRDTFHRAADLLREAVNTDGVVFLDTLAGTQGGNPNDVEYQSTSEPSSDDGNSGTDGTGTESEGRTKPDESREGTEEKFCRPLSLSMSSNGGNIGVPGSDDILINAEIPERFLTSLLRRFPRGKVWSFNEDGDGSSDDESASDGGRVSDVSPSPSDTKAKEAAHSRRQRPKLGRVDDGREIQRIFPGVRSLALVGMWDQTRSRWFAACAIWTYSPLRVFSVEFEANYLAAFCDVIMAEVHRLEALNSDRAKSDFISTISHELRSPLHGILGSVECLQEQPMDSFSTGLVSQVSVLISQHYRTESS